MNTNPEIELAEQYVNTTGISIFLTGKAGTGKTTFLRHVVETVKKRHVVVAPTGVAAVNAGGVTIHSFFQLPFCPYLPDVPELVTEYQMPDQMKQLRKSKADIIRTLDLLIIDEISMVRADLLDAVDATLRRYRRNDKPFGGVQLLMIGDVQQLPPVVTDEERPFMQRVYPSPFFFHSKALQRMPYVTIQLQTIYRQSDQTFVQLLNSIRDNRFDSETLALLNSRVAKGQPQSQDGVPPILLTTHNYQADSVNARRMKELPSEEQHFQAIIEGNYPESSAATDVDLCLKVGAQVMFVKNDTSGEHRYFNGKIATVKDFVHTTDENGNASFSIMVVDEDGKSIFVSRERWENIRYEIDSKDNQIKQIVDGTFTQYPLRPAWAITIHKAQGLTFDRVVVDASAAFSYGQVYVALSRCRSLEGLTLQSPITSACAIDSAEVTQFNESIPAPRQVQDALTSCQMQYTLSLLEELFDTAPLQPLFGAVNRLYQNDLLSTYPKYARKCVERISQLTEIVEVSRRFHLQLHSLVAKIGEGPSSQQTLDDRVAKGSRYFLDQLTSLETGIEPLLDVDIDNKVTRKSMEQAAENLREYLGMKIACLDAIQRHTFTVQLYLKTKVDYTLNRDKAKARQPRMSAIYADNAHPRLVPMLMQWRKEVAAELGAPAFHVMSQKTLLEVADKLPKSLDELLKVKGLGKVKVKMFGLDLLRLLARYCDENGINFPRTAEMEF